MTHRALFIAALFATACTANARADTETASMTDTPTANTSSAACQMVLNFSESDEVSTWQTVLDGVMGGKSSGARFAQDGHMVFRGVINTDGGGFSSIRRPMPRGAMDGAETLRLKIKQDERNYKLTFRTSASSWGRSVSYQRPIPATPPGEWAEVEIPLRDFDTSIFGRTVRAPAFDASDVREMGIILADGIDGAFRIEVAEIGCPVVTAT